MQQQYETSLQELTRYVDALEASFNSRLKAAQDEYKANLESILHNYRIESQGFDRILLEKIDEISRLRSDLKTFKDLYKKEKVEHNITKDLVKQNSYNV